MASRLTWVNVGGVTSLGEATVTASTDLITVSSHGLSVGDLIAFDTIVDADPLETEPTYFVRNVDGDDFQISGSRGGPVVGFDTDGTAESYTSVPSYSAEELRQVDSHLLFHGSSNRLGAREGVRPGAGAPITVSSGSWQAQPHTGSVDPAVSSTQGPYTYIQLQTDPEPLDPADGTNDRLDAIDLQVSDDDADGSTERGHELVYVTGSPASDPSAPPLTARSLRLATILVPAGEETASTVQSTSQWTVASGGVLPVRDDSELPSDPYMGMTVWDLELGIMLSWDGSDWHPGAGTVELDEVELTGTVGGGTDITIPTRLQGRFRTYTLEIRAGGPHTNTPLVVRVNGIGSSEYRANTVAWGTNPVEDDADREQSANAFPRVGYCGEFTPSILTLRYQPGSLGDTGSMVWAGNGWANNGGSGSTLVLAGGRWLGSTQTLTHFTIRTDNTDDTWSPNSRATLWGHP